MGRVSSHYKHGSLNYISLGNDALDQDKPAKIHVLIYDMPLTKRSPGNRTNLDSQADGLADENIYTCLNLPPPANPTPRAGLCVWPARLLV